MTVKEISKRTGFSTDTIYKFIRDGVIEATLVQTRYGIKQDVDPGYIPSLKKRKKSKVVGKKAIVKVKYEDVKNQKRQSLRNAVIELMEYNEKNNTNLSYGYATAMNII